MNDTPADPSSVASSKAAARHHFWDESWIGVFILMLIAAALGGLLSRLWPGGDGLFATPAGELAERVSALDARVIQLANAQSATPADDLNVIRERLRTVEERLKAAETALASNPQTKPVATSTPTTHQTANGTPAPSLEEAVKQLQDLQARLAVVELGATASAAAPGAPARMLPAEAQQLKDGLAKATETVTALSARLDAVTAKVDAAADPAPLIAVVRGDIDAVKGRVEKIEQADLAGSARRAALGAAVANLSRAAQSGQPFQAELSVARGLQPADANLAAVAAFADKGVAVPSVLQARFATYADAAVKAERDATTGEGLDRLWSGVTAMVTVRTTGTPNGADTGSILARADAKLKAGDLRAAHAETERLAGPARTAMEPWRREAAARVKLDAAIAAASRSIADSLAKSATTTSAPASAP